MKPPNRPSPIPLYPVPPIPPNSRPERQSRNSSELSDGFPPIRIFKTPPLAPSSSIPQAAPSQSHHQRHMKTRLGDKNILNTIDLKKPARNVMRPNLHSHGAKLSDSDIEVIDLTGTTDFDAKPRPSHQPKHDKRNRDHITINLTDSDSEDSERPSKRPCLTAIEDDDMVWLKNGIGSLRGEVNHMRHDIKSLERSFIRLTKCLVLLDEARTSMAINSK